MRLKKTKDEKWPGTLPTFGAMSWFNRANPEFNKLYDAALFTLSFLLICWSLYLFQTELGYLINKWGLRPRESVGLIGIGSMHFLHSTHSVDHILNNTLSFVVLNTMLFYFYRSLALKTVVWIMLAGAALLWLWGRQSNHIGASLLIFGITGFLFFSGVFRSDPRAMRIAMLVAFWYGSIIWWVFPIDPAKSWEGHASGLAVGIFLAFWFRKEGPQRPLYQWEVDEMREAEEALQQAETERLARLEAFHEQPRNFGPTDDTSGIDIRYSFKPKGPDSSTETED